MKPHVSLLLACLTVGLSAAKPVSAEVVIFQEGVNSFSGLPDLVNGYVGTQDVEFFAGTPETSLGQMLGISIDQSSGGFPSQAALRFDNIFADQGGLVPRDEEILFAEVELSVTSETDLGARITFNRVLGPDQNRKTGSGPWNESDTWSSLGGEEETTGDPPMLLGDKPIAVGISNTLAVGNEAIDSLSVDSFDGNGKRRGLLDRELNLADLVELVRDGVKVTVDVTNSLQEWQAGAPNLGWAINNDTSGGWDFLTSEWHIDEIPEDDVPQFEFILGELGRESEQMRPLLRVVYGVDGDVNGNGSIDLEDFNILRSGLGDSFADRGMPGDLDFDRDIDLADFVRFKHAYDAEFGEGALAAAIQAPEPASSGLLLGLALTVAMRRRASGC